MRTNKNDQKLFDLSSVEYDKLTEVEQRSWITNLQILFSYNRICVFLSKQMKTYNSSNFPIFTSAIGLFLLVVFTVISFSLINYGLFKIDPSNFLIPSSPTFFNFFFFSFYNIFPNQISDIQPITVFSKISVITESSLTFVLLAIGLTVIFPVQKKKEEQEVNSIIEDLSKQGSIMEKYILEKYEFNDLEEVMELIHKVKAILAEFIYKLTQSLD